MKRDTDWIRSLTSRCGRQEYFTDLPLSDRRWLARALRDLHDELSVDLGSLLIADPDPGVRAEVALGLGEIGYRLLIHSADSLAKRTLQQLGTLATDPEWFVRVNVAYAALQYGNESVMPVVHSLLGDREEVVRSRASECYRDLTALHPNTAAKLAAGESGAGVAYYTAKGTPSLGRFWAPRRTAASVQMKGGPVRFSMPEFKLDDPIVQLTGDATSGASGSTAGVSHATEAHSATHFEKPSLREEAGDEGSRGSNTGSADIGSDDGALGPAGSSEYLDLQSGSRYVNSWFVGHGDPLKPLEFRRPYMLGIEVAPEPRVGSFTAGDPKLKEPHFEGKETIEITVAIVSEDFEISGRAAGRMTLPRDPGKRSQQISFTVAPTKNNQDVFIHVFFYYQNNLFHEALIGAHVQVLHPHQEEGATAALKPVTRFYAPVQGPRDANLQVIEIKGYYRLVLFYDFGGDDFDILSCLIEVNRDRIVDLLAGVREDLLSVVNTTVTTPGGSKKKVFFDGEPEQVPLEQGRLPNLLRIADEIYVGTLRKLARAGSRLYVNLFESGAVSDARAQRASEFGRKLRELSARQALRLQVISDEFFIPWNLLFDGDVYQAHIDPSQFWGFRHSIEEVPGSSRAERIEPMIPVGDEPVRVALNVNIAAIPNSLTMPQRATFRKWGAPIHPIERLNELDVLVALQGKQPQGEIEYFYCHAGVAGASHNYFDQSYLGLTSSESGLTLEDIKIAMIERKVFDSRPVVFLNACESGRMDGRFYDGFVPQFLKMGARAVLGTDCEVPSLFGAHFGTQFLQAILKGQSVGAALLAQRKSLLEEFQNPLGLIYRVFGNAETQFSRALI